MALWIVFYGTIQINAPKILQAVKRGHKALLEDAWRWAAWLALVPLILAIWMHLDWVTNPIVTSGVVIGLLIFGGIFAVNSSLHSYLILAFTKNDRVTMDVGFYYMSNATGRLIGTLYSGVTYQIGGASFCLAISSLMILISAYCARRLQ